MIKIAFGGKIKYIPYPKNITVDRVKSVQFVAQHFNISEEKANEYLNYISNEELKYIVQMYTDLELKRKQ